MKVLVTGGAGFIGSHIIDALLAEGHDVVAVDSLSTGFRYNINPRAKFYPTNIVNERLRQVFSIEKPDVVIHEAAQTVVTRSLKEPLYDAQVNILGGLNVLNNCAEFKVKRVLYASSCAIYGAPEYLPIDERHPLNAISHYGVSKQTLERYLNTYYRLYGIGYCALRYSNVYGPRQNPWSEAGVVAIFSRQMLSGNQPTIYGDGSKTRSYVYVGDVVRANLMAMKSEKVGIYNIGTSKETTDHEMFNLIKKSSGFTGNPLYQKERPGEIIKMCLDSTKARDELGWEPQVKLEDGIPKTVAFYRDQSQLRNPRVRLSDRVNSLDTIKQLVKNAGSK